MAPRWSLTFALHLMQELVFVSIGELSRVATAESRACNLPDARSPASGEPSTPSTAAEHVLPFFYARMHITGAWAVAWSAVTAWWLATGRGPGGRLLAAQSVWGRRAVPRR